MSEQQVKYTITADASQANSELARVDKAAVSLVGNEKALATETAKATKAIADQGKAASTTAASTETLRQRIGKSAENLSKQAAAVSLVSSSMEGMGGQVGKMVAGAGQMAAAYGAGGPFAVALVGGMALIQGITDHFESARLEAERLDDVKFHKMTDGIVKLSKVVQDIKTETQGLLRELDPEGAKVQDLFAVAEESMKLRADANKLSNQSMAADKVIVFADRQRMRKEVDLMLQQADALEAKVLVMNKLIEKDNKPKSGGSSKATEKRSDLGVRFLSSEAGAAERTRGFAIDADDNDILTVTDKQATLIEMERKFQGTLREIRDEERKKEEEKQEKATQLHLSRLEDIEGESLAARIAFNTLAMDHKMDNLDKLKAHEFKNLKDTAGQYESMYNDLGALAEGATSTLIGTSQNYFKAKIEGAENAEALAAAAFLSGVGQQLVGIGTKNLFEGAGMLIASGGVDPRGYALTALGAGAIAAGVGMGAGSAAISHTAAGGTIGKEPPDDKKVAKDKGASPGRSGNGGGGGPLIVNVAYGAGGPLPEDTAREIQKAVDTGRRRGGR